MQYREHYLQCLEQHDPNSIKFDSNTPLVECSRPIIRVYHDESTFYANANQSQYWSDSESQILRQKSLGSSIMVSDFVDEVSGYLCCGEDKARLQLEPQKDGYFNNVMFMKQVERMLSLFERKYPNSQGLFIFDNAPSHRKFPENGLNADRMNVNPGGKQPAMRSTVWDGAPQEMTLPDGTPKGLRIVLEERGVNTCGMNAKKMREILATHEDFSSQKTILEELVESQSHICLFLPRFHCELNPIERVWCHSKKHNRANVNGSITRLRDILPHAFDSCSPELIKKFFRTCREYEKAYHEGCTGRMWIR